MAMLAQPRRQPGRPPRARYLAPRSTGTRLELTQAVVYRARSGGRRRRRLNMRIASWLVALVFGLPTAPAVAQAPLYSLPDGIETRWASPENPSGARGAGGETNAGRKGRAFVPVASGATHVLAEAAGTSGMVRRIWLTLSDRSPAMLRALRLQITWDGAARPAVDVPLGDFFGHALGEMHPISSAFFQSPEGRSMVSVVPMPFRSGMRIAVVNESAKDLAQLFYDVNYTLGDPLGADALYFHAAFRREPKTTLQRDFEILPRVAGRGRYLGATLGVIADQRKYGRSWWGEGEVKIYLDGDTSLPTLNGTGTEDYIATGYGQGAYSQPHHGCPLADREAMRYGFYRYHVPDPVYFRKDVRVTVQQIGYFGTEEMGPMQVSGERFVVAGPGRVPLDLTKPNQLFEREDDWSAVAYFYLDRPENGLPPLSAVAERVAGMR
jgi:hypothetical protein